MAGWPCTGRHCIAWLLRGVAGFQSVRAGNESGTAWSTQLISQRCTLRRLQNWVLVTLVAQLELLTTGPFLPVPPVAVSLFTYMPPSGWWTSNGPGC